MTTELEGEIEVWVLVVIGGILLLLGRRIFWVLGGLAVSVVGATVLIIIAIVLTVITEPGDLTVTTEGEVFPLVGKLAAFSVPIVGGALIGFLIGIYLTVRYPKIAAAVVGFVAGGLILFLVIDLFGFDMLEWVRGLLFIIAGTFVAIVAVRQIPETLIIISTFLGANILLGISRLDFNSPSSAFVWLFLMLVGIIFQMNMYRKEQHRAAGRQRTPARVAPASSGTN